MGERTSGQRVKTGCMTCRGRRRKCDEQKPECANCRSKGLTCRYGGKLTFVMSKFQDEAGDAALRSRQSRETTTRVGSSADAPLTSSSQGIGEFPQSLDGLLASSVPFSQPIPAGIDLTPETQTRNHPTARSTPQQQHQSYAQTPVFDPRNLRRSLYELDLLTFYRYHVAPILDLGVGSLCFGVHFLVTSKTSEGVYHAVLAVASSQRASVSAGDEQIDHANSIISAHLARSDSGIKRGPLAIPEILLLWRDVYLTPIHQWSTMSHHVQNPALVMGSLEEWVVLSRIHCAVSLIARTRGSDDASFPFPPQATVDGKFSPAMSQLGESLWLLIQTLSLLIPDSRSPSSPGFLGPPDWHAQWQHLQQWYSRRSDDMRQIFELGDEEIVQFEQQESHEFPVIVFSNACAIVANVAHHVASLILLQSKPRLTKPSARSNSSTSPFWHAHRAIGIIFAATDAEIWDPFMTAALIHCTRKLSHSKQICSVANTMKRLQLISGLKLDEAIGNLEELARHT